MSISFDDKNYWIEFYKKLIREDITLGPSPFARDLVEGDYINKGMSIIELGCGNGRDSKFFANIGVDVLAIDQCPNITRELNNENNITSFAHDFTRLDDFTEKFDMVYSRFTMHSINEDDEERTVAWSYNNLKKGGLFCVEARTTKDPIYGKGEHKGNNVWFYNGHHRRFLEPDTFKTELKEVGFEFLQFEEDNGFAKFKDEDPIVLRSIVRK